MMQVGFSPMAGVQANKFNRQQPKGNPAPLTAEPDFAGLLGIKDRLRKKVILPVALGLGLMAGVSGCETDSTREARQVSERYTQVVAKHDPDLTFAYLQTHHDSKNEKIRAFVLEEAAKQPGHQAEIGQWLMAGLRDTDPVVARAKLAIETLESNNQVDPTMRKLLTLLVIQFPPDDSYVTTTPMFIPDGNGGGFFMNSTSISYTRGKYSEAYEKTEKALAKHLETLSQTPKK